MKNPSPGSCFGGCGRSGDRTVPIGAALTTTMRRTFVAFIAWTMARVPCGARLLEHLPTDAPGRCEDRELHLLLHRLCLCCETPRRERPVGARMFPSYGTGSRLVIAVQYYRRRRWGLSS